MINYIVKYFNKERKIWTNQQVAGVREIFRGIAVKSLVAIPVESVNFTIHDKKIIKKEVDFYSEYWKER